MLPASGAVPIDADTSMCVYPIDSGDSDRSPAPGRDRRLRMIAGRDWLSHKNKAMGTIVISGSRQVRRLFRGRFGPGAGRTTAT